MRGARAREEHRAAVARRLARLGDEVVVLREPPPGDEVATHTRVRPAAGRGGRGAVLSGGWSDGGDEADEGWRGVSWDVEAHPADSDEPGLGPVPVPGRHAARRRRALPGPGLLGPAQLAVVAVAVALGLAVTCWWLLRSGAEPVPLAARDAPSLVTPAAVPAGPPGRPVGGSPVGGSEVGGSPVNGSEVRGQPEPASLVVDVAGKVRRPGIAVLAPGSRVVDAIEAAGGARRGVDLSSLNLARLLVDGEQILVGVPGGPEPGPAGAAEDGGLLVNLNTADQAELESLPEVGPVTAQAIIAWREQHGGFTSVDQLVDVDGIGEATLATVSPFVTV